MEEKLNISHYFLFILIFAALFLCYRMISPYLDPIIFALILSVLANPLYERLEKKAGGRKNLSAAIMCLLLIFIVVVPLLLIGSVVIRQGIISFNAMNAWISAGNLENLSGMPLIKSVTDFYDKFFPDTTFLSRIDVTAAIGNFSSNAGKILIRHSTGIIGNLTEMVMSFGLMVFVFFFVVQNTKRLSDYICHLMPLSAAHQTVLVEKMKAVSRSAVLGTLVTAAGQGVAGGAAFAVCGLPGFFWGAVIAFASLIPVVGTALVWVPAVIYLSIAGRVKSAVFLAIWFIVVVGLIDNFVRPLFMSGASSMSTVVIFFAIIGGLQLFGLAGLLYGPLIFGITLVLFYIYSLEFESFLNRQDGRG